MEFIQGLRIFFSFRGCPAVLLSDKGSQMLGAERELSEMVKGLHSDKLIDVCGSTNWLFTAPAAPLQNGCAKALVKSCKRALEEVNSRTDSESGRALHMPARSRKSRKPTPYRPCSKRPDDGKYLCLNDMLLGGQHRKFLRAHSMTRNTRDAA